MTNGSTLRLVDSVLLRMLLALAVSLPLLARHEDAVASGRLARVRQLVRPGRLARSITPRSSHGTAHLGAARSTAPAKPRITTRIKERLKRLPRKAKIATAATAVVLVASSVMGGFYLHARAANQQWTHSPSHGVVLQVEQAVADRDVAALDRVGDQARAKYTDLERQIASARATGAEKLASGMSLGEAERELDFAGLAVARADLEEVLLSQDAGERIGGSTAATWSGQIGGAESSARTLGFEGNLALQLKALHTELKAQDATADRLSKAIDEFGDRVPRLWGDEMRSDLNHARSVLSRFRDGEMSSERALYDRTNGAMRGRVSDRLASENPEFAGHRARMTRLSSLQDDLVRPADELAQQIDDDLGSVISHRNNERNYLAIAATKTHVPVTKTRTACCRTETVNGQTRSVSYTETYTDFEDQSGMWRAMAASEASSAQSAARSAQRGLDQLRPMIVKLHNNPTIQAEGLVAMLPDGANTSISSGHGAIDDWFLPPLFNLFSNAGSQASEARGEFRAVMGALGRVDSTVGERRGAERSWVESSITSDLDGQMARAEAGEGPTG